MFPGRRLTRWCQLVPRVLLLKNGKAYIAATTAKKKEGNEILSTTHSITLTSTSTSEAPSFTIVLADAESSSAGDVGFLFLRVAEADAAKHGLLMIDQHAGRSHESSSLTAAAATAVSAPRQEEALEQQKALQRAVDSCLKYAVRHRASLERGTNCSCLIFEVSGTSQPSGDYTRETILTAIRRQQQQQSSSRLVVMYSELSIIDYICRESRFANLVASSLSSSFSSSNPQQRQLPSITIPRQVLMKKLTEAVMKPTTSLPPSQLPQRKPPEVPPPEQQENQKESKRAAKSVYNSNNNNSKANERKVHDVDTSDMSAADGGRETLLQSRLRMLRLIKSIEQKKSERLHELEQITKDYELLSAADDVLNRSENLLMRKTVAQETGHDDGDEDLRLVFVDYDVDDDVDDNAAASNGKREGSYFLDELVDSPRVRNTKQIVFMSPDEKNVRLQESLLNLLILKICNQQISHQFAAEMAEAERKLL